MKNLDSIPSWDLHSIWSDLESPEYKTALAEYTDGLAQLEKIISAAKLVSDEANCNFDFAKWLTTWYPVSNKVGALEESLIAYAYIIYSTETTNTKYLNNLSKLEQMGLESQKIHIEFQKILVKNKAKLRDFFKRFPEYEEYHFIIQEELDDAEHQMSVQEENLASDLQRTGGDAWSRLQEQIISTLKDKESSKTFNELRNDAYSDDGKLRKESYKKELALLQENQVALAACLNNLKGETCTLNKRRSWNSAIDRALVSSRMSRKTLDSLISAIEDSLPDWRKYLKAKSEYLHKKNATASSDKSALAFYDLFAPVSSVKEKIWTFEEAKAYIIEEYSSFSEEMGAFAKKAFDSNWIDAKVHPGKVGGAYCQDFPLQKESRVLTNFTGTFSDVVTLAHELGHAYHHSCITGNPYTLSSYPMTLAETASTFAETIVKQDMIARAKDEDTKLKVLELDLQDSCQVLVDILSRYYFESSVFEERQKGELSAEDFCNLMLKAQEKSYGDGLNSEKHPYIWAVKSHYYSTGLDFYNFPYAFGQLFAAGLYQLYKKEGKSFAKKYSELLADTGKMDCEDLCAKAGFDISTKDFWKSGIELYQKEITLFTELVK